MAHARRHAPGSPRLAAQHAACHAPRHLNALVSSLHAPAPGARDNSIGCTRLLLAALVLYGHGWYASGREAEEPIARWLLAGADNPASLGVKGFFLLSGFLVFRSEQRLVSTRRFLWHRLVRIYPGLWACLLLTGLAFPALAWSLAPAGTNWTSALGYVWRNTFLIREQVGIDGMFANVPKPGEMNGSLWTLPFEIACYTGLALAGWLGLTQKQSRAPWLVGAGLVLLYFFDVAATERGLFFRTPGRILTIWFVLGALASMLDETRLKSRVRGGWAVLSVALYAGACRLGFATIAGPFLLFIPFLWLMWRLPGKDLEHRLGGDYSYGLYIYGYPVEQALAASGLHRAGIGFYLGAAAVISLGLAIASWHLIEKHVLRLKSLGAA